MLLFESKDTEVFEAGRNKLFARNEKQTDNHTLMLDMLHSNMSVVCTYHCRDVFHEKYFLVWLLFFVDLCSQKKLVKALNFNFYVHKDPPRWKSRRPYGLMFIRHLHSPQLYIQAILYIYKTDYMMSLTHYILTSVCIFSMLFSIHFLTCRKGEFV